MKNLLCTVSYLKYFYLVEKSLFCIPTYKSSTFGRGTFLYVIRTICMYRWVLFLWFLIPFLNQPLEFKMLQYTYNRTYSRNFSMHFTFLVSLQKCYDVTTWKTCVQHTEIWIHSTSIIAQHVPFCQSSGLKTDTLVFIYFLPVFILSRLSCNNKLSEFCLVKIIQSQFSRMTTTFAHRSRPQTSNPMDISPWQQAFIVAACVLSGSMCLYLVPR